MKFVCIFAIMLAIFSGCAIDKKMEINKQSPDISVLDLEGKNISLADFKGKSVVLVFYKNGCISCTESLPQLNNFIKDKAESLKIIAINAKNTKNEIKKFATQHNFENLTITQDNLSITSQRFGVVMTPTFILIDKNHIVRDKIVGSVAWKNIENSINQII